MTATVMTAVFSLSEVIGCAGVVGGGPLMLFQNWLAAVLLDGHDLSGGGIVGRLGEDDHGVVLGEDDHLLVINEASSGSRSRVDCG